MIDWTFHMSDLATLTGLAASGAYVAFRTIRRSVHRHLDRIDSHEDELTLHAIELERRGWKRPADAQFRLKYGRRAEDRAEI